MSDWVRLFIMLYMTVVGLSMGAAFVESRFSRCRTVWIVCSAIIMISALVVLVYLKSGIDTLVQAYPLIVHLPSLLLFMLLSSIRGWRLVFQIFSAVLFCNLIHHGGGLIFYLTGQQFWSLLSAYLLLTAGMFWFLMRWLRPLFYRVCLLLNRGWWMMCLIIAMYYWIGIYLIPGYVGESLSSTMLKPAISCLMIGFYAVLMVFLSLVQREEEARHDAQMFSMQVSALQKRMDAIRGAEEMVRVERHDLRHRLLTVGELVKKGKTRAALDFIGLSEQRLNEKKTEHWCRPPVMDAVFTAYLEEAKQQKIRTDVRIALPDSLPVAEGEFAIVLANALENAIHACLELPEDERRLQCRVIAHPQLMMEIKNTYAGTVRLDARGMPGPSKAGHGWGTQSIAAFCRKYRASCQYETRDGWFILRIVL